MLVNLTGKNPGSKGGGHGAGAPGDDHCLAGQPRLGQTPNGAWCQCVVATSRKTIRETMRPFVRQGGKKRLPLYDFHRSFRLSWDNRVLSDDYGNIS